MNECNLVLGNEVNLQWGALWCKECAGLFFWWGQTDLAVWGKHGKYPRVPKYNLLRPSCMAFALLDGWVWGPIIQGPLIANTRLYLVLIEWIEELSARHKGWKQRRRQLLGELSCLQLKAVALEPCAMVGWL